jgi:anti-sigma-K factor RskA
MMNEQGQEKKTTHLWRNIAVVVGAIVVIAALVVCLVPIVEVQYTEKELYTATETYYE